MADFASSSSGDGDGECSGVDQEPDKEDVNKEGWGKCANGAEEVVEVEVDEELEKEMGEWGVARQSARLDIDNNSCKVRLVRMKKRNWEARDDGKSTKKKKQYQDPIKDHVKNQLQDQITEEIKGQIKPQILDQVKMQLKEQMMDLIKVQIKGQSKDEIKTLVLDQIKKLLKDLTKDQAKDEIKDQIREQIVDYIKDQIEDMVKNQTWRTCDQYARRKSHLVVLIL